MFCATHKERIAISTCANCSKGICSDCQTTVGGQYWCKDCAGTYIPSSYAVLNTRNPWVAAISSLILPGIGQVYNGQVVKGVVIFLSFWLVLPWIYGVFDALITGYRINRGEVDAKPQTGCLVGCLAMIFIVAASPYYIIKGMQYLSLITQINAEETLAISTLRKISEAAESYAKVNGKYPTSYSALYFADPPYLKEIYCDVSLAGGKYNCVFSSKGYLVTVKPETESSLKTTFSITTGGVLVPFEQKAILAEDQSSPEEADNQK